jgi:hypothetical protein
VPPSKSRSSSLLTKGRKEVISTRTLQGITFPAYPSLRNTSGAPGEKVFKTPTTGAQEIKIITKNNSRCVNLNTE